MGNINRLIDLHLHLDGAITVDIAKKLAALQGIKLPEDDRQLKQMLTVPEGCTSLNEFLECFALPCSLIQTKEGIAEAVYLVSESISTQGVIYAEIRFAPQKCTDRGLSQEEAILAALEGLKRTDLKANLILCCMRGDDNDEANFETVELAKKYLVEDGGVVAVDLAGAEALFPTCRYKALFDRARKLGIPFTIHAGEAAGADSVKCALEYGATRIGHGVRITEDIAVLREVKERGVFLEMCPTSNSQTQAVLDMSTYPLIDFIKKGIKVTINTDDPAIEGTTLAKEFELVRDMFGITKKQEKEVVDNAIDAAFTTQEVKDWLRREVEYVS